MCCCLIFFFFQAEDGIRDHCVTGVQTCALPIYRLMLGALRESGGGVAAVSESELVAAARELQTVEGVDASPEGGASLAGALALKARGAIEPGERVVIFSTGAGWLYRA